MKPDHPPIVNMALFLALSFLTNNGRPGPVIAPPTPQPAAKDAVQTPA